jgi:hypothetical protein
VGKGDNGLRRGFPKPLRCLCLNYGALQREKADAGCGGVANDVSPDSRMKADHVRVVHAIDVNSVALAPDCTVYRLTGEPNEIPSDRVCGVPEIELADGGAAPMPRAKSQSVPGIGGAGKHSGGLRGGKEAMKSGFGEAQSSRKVGGVSFVSPRQAGREWPPNARLPARVIVA